MRNFFTLLFTIVTIVVSAQIFTPVSWEFSQNQLSENEVELIFKASIDEHWHLYSQDIADDGPVAKEAVFPEFLCHLLLPGPLAQPLPLDPSGCSKLSSGLALAVVIGEPIE